MKKIASFVIVLLTLSACTQQKQEAIKETDNEKIVQQYFAYFNKHEFGKMANMYSDTAEFKDPSLGQGIIKQSKQQIEKKYTALAEVFPDLHDRIVQMYSSGNKHIVVEFVSSGTGKDKSTFELPICTIFTIENGLITKDYTYFDNFEEAKSK